MLFTGRLISVDCVSYCNVYTLCWLSDKIVRQTSNFRIFLLFFWVVNFQITEVNIASFDSVVSKSMYMITCVRFFAVVCRRNCMYYKTEDHHVNYELTSKWAYTKWAYIIDISLDTSYQISKCSHEISNEKNRQTGIKLLS